MRSAIIAAILLPATAGADASRAVIAGIGSRTRQQAIQRIFRKLPDVESVTILPGRDAPAGNQRYFVIESRDKPPTREDLVAALGQRAGYYRILTVEPVPVSKKS